MIFLSLPKIMIICLISTIIIELILVLILKVKNKKDILNILLVNTLTNPLLVCISAFIKYFYGISTYNICILFLELIAILIEGYIYKKYLDYNKINGYLLSIILNVSSYSLGFLINGIIW